MMGNFLTTLGAEPAEDRAMFEQHGLNVARQPDNAANPRPDNRSEWLSGETPDVIDELLDGAAAGRRERSRATAAAPSGGLDVRLVSGTMTVHRRLEERLAAFKGSEACVLFGSGYLANLGVIGALAGRGDTVFSDELNHASIVDGCRLSRAQVVVYRHADIEHLEWSMLRRARRRGEGGDLLVVTDSV